jgi:hypothetical protein
MSNHYSVKFRGDTIASFQSVYDVQALVLGHRTPTGPLVLLDRYKTVKSAKRVAASLVDNYSPSTPVRSSSGLFNPQAFSTFVIEATPGNVEIYDAAIVAEYDTTRASLTN